MASITVQNIPDNLLRRFNRCCVENDTSFSATLIELMQRHVAAGEGRHHPGPGRPVRKPSEKAVISPGEKRGGDADMEIFTA